MTREERVDWLCRLRCWVVPRPNMTVEQKSKCIEALTEVIDDLQTGPCEDCISRQAVLDTIDSYMAHHMGFLDLKLYVKELPSVQPEPKEGSETDADSD